MKKLIMSLLIAFTLCGCAWSADLRPGEMEFNNALNLYHEQKDTEAFAEFQKGAEKGFPDCIAWIGICYFEGVSVNKDINKALDYLKKSADLGSPYGFSELGASYTFGQYGVPQNILLGIEYLEKAIAAENPRPVSFYNMGVTYEEGIGRGKDVQKALEMYEKAASLGFSLAKEAIDNIRNSVASAQSLIVEVGQNQMRFDRNNKDRALDVSGYVGRIGKKGKDYILELFGEKGFTNPFRYIECRFTEEHVDALLDLNRDDAVRVKGTYRGKQDFQVGALVLFDCEIVQ